ncbi:MAG: hypothetical protein QM723_19420 [Myxococcaceae bacterium]
MRRENLLGLGSTMLLAACATSSTIQRSTVDGPAPSPSHVAVTPVAAPAPEREPLPAPPPPPSEDAKEDWAAFPVANDGAGAPMANFVRKLIGLKTLRHVSGRVPDDCTGLVRLAYWQASVELLGVEGERGDNGVMAIFRHAEALGAIHFRRPEAGDLVFFRETYDRNKDGKVDDGLTHVGVVMRTEADGTVVFAHRVGTGVEEGRLNPDEPAQHDTKGHVLNDWLRPASKHARASLTGELFSGFASAEKLVRAAALGRR